MEQRMFANFQKKMQLMAIMKPKPSKYNTQAVFNAWRLFVSLNQHDKMVEKLKVAQQYVLCRYWSCVVGGHGVVCSCAGQRVDRK